MSAWQRLTRTVAPATAAISLATAKAHLRVEFADDDGYIEQLIEAATATVEGPNGIGLALVTQTWKLTRDGGLFLPMELPLGPVQSVTSVSYVDTDGAPQTLSSDAYDVFSDRRPAVIDLAYGASLPSVRKQLNAATVTFVAGFGATPDAIPADLRSALLLMIGHWYHQREAVVVGTTAVQLPMGVASILERYRCGRFGE